MAGLRARGLALGIVLAAVGLFIQLSPRISASTNRNEPWLLKQAPLKVGPYTVSDTYKMDDATYKELKPYGIVAQKLSSGDRSFDVVLVASNRKESFHDPRVCFTAQGWNIASQVQKVVKTSRGDIPVTVAKMTHAGAGARFAAFCYKGPGGFYSTPQSLTFNWLLKQLKGDTNSEAVFYRFIPEWDGATEKDLFEFVAAYLKSAQKSSGGYF